MATLTRDEAIAKVRKWMHDQVGTQERPRGSNRQPYGKKFGWDGVPWCAIFSWCGCQAAGLGSKFFPKTAAVAAVKAHAIRTGRWGHKPQVGAFGLYPGGASHIFWVDKILSGGRVQTVEGNTNPDGGREGYGVFKRIRSASNVGGYFYPRWGEAIAKEAPAPKPVPELTREDGIDDMTHSYAVLPEPVECAPGKPVHLRWNRSDRKGPTEYLGLIGPGDADGQEFTVAFYFLFANDDLPADGGIVWAQVNLATYDGDKLHHDYGATPVPLSRWAKGSAGPGREARASYVGKIYDGMYAQASVEVPDAMTLEAARADVLVRAGRNS